MIIGERLSELRKDKNLSQKELGKILNVSRNSISLYECSRRSPPDEIKKDIALYFNTSIDYLIGLSDLKYRDTKRYLELPENLDEASKIQVNEFAKYLASGRSKK